MYKSEMRVALLLILSYHIQAWTSTALTARDTIRLSAAPAEGDDLFEYFDPLLSPHAYPNGISPDHKPQAPEATEEANVNPFSFPNLEASPGSMHAQYLERQRQHQTTEPQKETEKDLFEYFDPLLSPHAYPNGVSPDQAPISQQEEQTPVPVARPLELVRTKQESASKNSGGSAKLGILLMDHGSRNAASNDRLLSLASLYQQTLAIEDPTIVVEAAHMEIAEPSIPTGLQALLDQGVDEIVCHPYFLSPGRHVREDIPEIVQGAIADMNIQIPVRTTDPVGSNTQLMIGAIHSLVRETSTVLRSEAK